MQIKILDEHRKSAMGNISYFREKLIEKILKSFLIMAILIILSIIINLRIVYFFVLLYTIYSIINMYKSFSKYSYIINDIQKCFLFDDYYIEISLKKIICNIKNNKKEENYGK